MLSDSTIHAIDQAGLKRAQMINDFCKIGYTIELDSKVTQLHTDLAVELHQNIPELCDYSLGTIKELVAQCSEDYIIDRSIYA